MVSYLSDQQQQQSKSSPLLADHDLASYAGDYLYINPENPSENVTLTGTWSWLRVYDRYLKLVPPPYYYCCCHDYTAELIGRIGDLFIHNV